MADTMFEPWFGENEKPLYDELSNVDGSIKDLFDAVVSEVRHYDNGLLEHWDAEGMRAKLGVYFLRYLLPFSELLRLEQRAVEPRLLVAELLSCCGWRSFDNCMDAHVPHKIAHLTSLLGYARLAEYARLRCSAKDTREIQKHYYIMTEQALQEPEEQIELCDIWKRCSIFVYPLESLARLSDASVALFRSYINYTGLAHDMADIIGDVSSGVLSLPVKWLVEINDRGALTVRVIEALFARLRDVVKPIEAHFAAFSVDTKLPLTSYLLKEAAAVFAGS